MPKLTPGLAGFVSAGEQRIEADQAPAEQVVQLGFRLPRSRWRALHDLALTERSSVQSILVEALQREFERRGLTF